MPNSLSFWGLMNDKAVTGVCLVKEGGGGGTWARVDEFGQPMALPGNYFDYHPVYAGMERVTIADQEMVRIPAFFVTNPKPASGPYAGRPCWVVSPTPREGFRLHPAFKNTAGDLDCVYIGAYLASDIGNSTLGSRPGKAPKYSLTQAVIDEQISALNTGGAAGFHMIRLYEWAALQWLILIELCTGNIQGAWALGKASTATKADDLSCAPWRNLWGLWGGAAGHKLTGLQKQDSTHRLQMEANDGSGDMVTTDFVPVSHSSLGSVGQCPLSIHSGQGDLYNFDDVFFPDTFTPNPEDATFPSRYVGRSSTSLFGAYVGHGSDTLPSIFGLNIGNGIATAYTSVGSRIAKHGSPAVYDAPAPTPKRAYVNPDAGAATILRPGNVLRVSNPAGAIRIDIPPHTGERTTTMLIRLEVLNNSEAPFTDLSIPCRQSLTEWPGENMTGGLVGSAGRLSSIRAAKASDGRACLILGAVAPGQWAEMEDVPDPVLYVCIREVTLLDPEEAYFDAGNWGLSMITSSSGLTYADDEITLW
jgi:hypothetical protein